MRLFIKTKEQRREEQRQMIEVVKSYLLDNYLDYSSGFVEFKECFVTDDTQNVVIRYSKLNPNESNFTSFSIEGMTYYKNIKIRRLLIEKIYLVD